MATRVRTDESRLQAQHRKIRIKGFRPLMFDRYPGDNDTKLDWYQKVYYSSDGRHLVLPAENVSSFLSAHNTNSAPKRLLDKRKYKDVANACLSFVLIGPAQIPILRDGKPIEVGSFEGGRDAKSGLWMHRGVARLDKGIPNPKERPTLPLPWEIEFFLSILPNKEIQEQQLLNLFQDGGLAIGFGTFRGLYGKFVVTSWEVAPVDEIPEEMKIVVDMPEIKLP